MELNGQEARTVAFPVKVTCAVHGTVRPVPGLTVAIRVTVPAKFWVLVRVSEIDAPVAPVLKLTGLAAEMEKSPT